MLKSPPLQTQEASSVLGRPSYLLQLVPRLRGWADGCRWHSRAHGWGGVLTLMDDSKTVLHEALSPFGFPYPAC